MKLSHLANTNFRRHQWIIVFHPVGTTNRVNMTHLNAFRKPKQNVFSKARVFKYIRKLPSKQMPRVQLGKYPVYGDPNSLKQADTYIIFTIYITLDFTLNHYIMCVVCLPSNARRLYFVVIIIDDPFYIVCVCNILF